MTSFSVDASWVSRVSTGSVGGGALALALALVLVLVVTLTRLVGFGWTGSSSSSSLADFFVFVASASVFLFFDAFFVLGSSSGVSRIAHPLDINSSSTPVLGNSDAGGASDVTTSNRSFRFMRI